MRFYGNFATMPNLKPTCIHFPMGWEKRIPGADRRTSPHKGPSYAT